jgi:hypothetical protein
MSTWRDSAKAHISEVVRNNPGIDLKAMKKKLREAYPYGERAMHPYKIWCDQVNKTLKVLYPEFRPRSAKQTEPNEPTLF